MGVTQSTEDSSNQSEGEHSSAEDHLTQISAQERNCVSDSDPAHVPIQVDEHPSMIRSTSSHLHRLPPELRRDVFRHFLNSATQTSPRAPHKLDIVVRKRVNPHSSFKVGPWEGATWRACIRPSSDFPLPRDAAALLSASPSLQAEVLDELLASTVLRFENTDALFGLMLQGGANLMKAIRYVEIKGKGSYNKEALFGLALCNRLESVTVIGARVTYIHTDRGLTITTLRHEPALEAVKGLNTFNLEVDKSFLNNEDHLLPPRDEDCWGPTIYRPFVRGIHPEFQLLEGEVKQIRAPVTNGAIIAWLRQNASAQNTRTQESYILNVVAERSGPMTLAGHFEAEAEVYSDVVQDHEQITRAIEP